MLLAAVFKSEALARRVGNGLGRVLSAFRRLFRKPPVTDAGDRAVKFRSDTIALVEHRWLALTWTTLLSHLALYFVLLLSLRHLGISEPEVSAAEVFAVFAFGRLISALPITPGGLGVIELGYIGGLVAAGGDKAGGRRRGAAVPHAHVRDPDPARRVHLPDLAGNKSWRRQAPDEDEAQTSAVVSG